MESLDTCNGLQPPMPPGFRFHPTDEELVVHYLLKKTVSAALPAAIIAEVDLYKFDPWELPEKAAFGEKEWYFFSPRDRKYPNGARPNRAATSGYWKATGTDKAVMTAGGTQKVGVKKALVFYRGKPPKGVKTDWIMHEYRLTENNKPPIASEKGSLRLDDWVLCRIYKKNTAERSVDQERDDVNKLFGSIPPINSKYGSFLENSCSSGSKLTEYHLPWEEAGSSDHHLLPSKRNLYWNEEADPSFPINKRILTDNCDGDQTMILQNPSLQQMLEDLGDGIFRQQSYHVSGKNWYS